MAERMLESGMRHFTFREDGLAEHYPEKNESQANLAFCCRPEGRHVTTLGV
jgi:hypothetical protein